MMIWKRTFYNTRMSVPKDVLDIHAERLKRGIDCVKYHGQLSQEEKLTNEMN